MLTTARKWILPTWVQTTTTGSHFILSISLSLYKFLFHTANRLLLQAEVCLGRACVCQKILVFAEITMLSNRITDYPLISQGKTRIPGVNDALELELTVVSRGLAWSVRVASDIRELIDATKYLIDTSPARSLQEFRRALCTGFITRNPVLAPALPQTNTYSIQAGSSTGTRFNNVASLYLIWWFRQQTSVCCPTTSTITITSLRVRLPSPTWMTAKNACWPT